MTELIWDGKYDKDGRRVAPVRIALPFQNVETVNESGAVRAHNLDLWSQGKPTEWRNRLIWGDKKYVLPSLLPELAGKVNLIYIDPPFATGADFSFTTTIPETGESFTKEPSLIEQKAYRDTWGRGLDGYLQWFYETAVLLQQLLADDGSIWIHIGTNVSDYVGAVADEVFGADNRRNQIAVKRITKNLQRQFNTIQSLPEAFDVIYWYSRSPSTRYKPVLTAQDPAHPEGYWKDFWSTADRPTMRYELLGVTPTAGQWKWRQERACEAVQNYEDYQREFETRGITLLAHWEETGQTLEFIRRSRTGKVEHWVPPLETKFSDTLWTDIPAYAFTTGYNTEKNEQLLDRIIQATSAEDDLVLDCFCGSGTTAIAAETLGRRWITCDLGRFAISTTRKRLLSIPNVRPFVVQNLGKYERQQWQVAEFAQGDQRESASAQLAYRRFMLDLYRAQPLEGGVWLHGLRDGHFVHVGSVDAPVALGDVQNIVREVWKAHPTSPLPVGEASGVRATASSPLPVGEGSGVRFNAVDVLGWDFAFELNEVARQMAAESNVRVHFKRIPREVLEKRAVEQGDIKFFELAALSVTVSQRDHEGPSGVGQERGPAVTLTLADYVVPPDDVPEDVQRAVKHWSQWIDYWAVDWDYQGDTFHNMAQTYRTRKDPKLQPSLAHTYAERGSYTVVVKVIDILGNDTTKTLKVEVA